MANKITESINNGFEKYLEKNGVNLKEVLNESNTPKKESKNINEAKRPMAKRKAPRPKRGVKSPADLARELENGTLNESAISFEDLKNTVSDALENIVYKYMHETGTVVSKEDLEKAIQFFENTFWSDPDAVYESLLNEKLPHDLVSNMVRYSDMDLENADGQEISEKQLQAIKKRDRYALKNVYVLLSDIDPKTGKKSIPYLQYNKQKHGEPVKYFYTYIPPYDLTNPGEAKRRGYKRRYNDLLRTDDNRGAKTYIDRNKSLNRGRKDAFLDKQKDNINANNNFRSK